MSIQTPELIGSFVKTWGKKTFAYTPISLISEVFIFDGEVCIRRTIDTPEDIFFVIGWHENENELQKMLIKFIKDIQSMEDEAPTPAPQDVDHGDAPDVDPFQILR